MKQKIFIITSIILFISGLFFYSKSLNTLNEIKKVHPVIVSGPNDYIDYSNEITNPYTDRHYDGFKWAQQNNMTSCDQNTLNTIGSDSFSEGCQKYIELNSNVKFNRKS